jgi:hypothetical protein
LEDDIDDCEDEDNRDDFLDCVYDALRFYSDTEIKPNVKRTIKRLARQFDFEPNNNDNKDGAKKGGRRGMLR